MSKFNELTKEIKVLEEHVKLYPHSYSTPLRKIRLNELKEKRAELIGKK